MAVNKKVNIIKYNKANKENKNFMYTDFRRASCYNCKFCNSNFDFASLRGAHFKTCDFYEASFEWTEFIGTNLKNSKFKRATFRNAVFDGVNLDGTDFYDARFYDCIFVGTDITKAENLKFTQKQVKVFDEMPTLEISAELEEAINIAMENPFIKESRTLDTKDRTISPISCIVLLEQFKEKFLITGLKEAAKQISKDFCTLSYIITAIRLYEKDGLI
ncbi:pentapeptide repeat-containing protein [uncultured Clostridium sp.]|jgi:hypothetical protein|uniref:pentapeptide repeat-containing protein n=1 Tax=uncultured Clostridium sp. TaxID=59620 RepID=UPI00260E7FB1|nr:pentapeptide repeat-containing protein [uncultured Clostridium sp.]